MPSIAVSGPAFRAIIVLVPLVELLGSLSSRIGSGTDNAWYQALTLPELQPPGIVFGLAWGVLYAMMAAAAGLVWATRVPGRTAALSLFAVQLALNLAWAPLFFREHQIFGALVLIGAIWAASVATTFAFARVNRVAAWLMVLYLVWLTFAAGLNWQLLQDNPGGGPTLLAEERV